MIVAELDYLDIFRVAGKPILDDDSWVPEEWQVGFCLARIKPSVDLLGKMSWPDLGGVFVGEIQRREWL